MMFSSPQRLLCISLFALVLTGHLTAQTPDRTGPELDSLSRYIHMKHGLDQELFNGLQYYERYAHFLGDPYFPENVFYHGAITLRGTEHTGVQLKFDIYAQQLILEYTDFQGRYNQLIIDPVHIDAFQLGSYRFDKFSLTGEEPVFYQVVHAGPVTCYIHWEKHLTSTSYDFQFTHEFTKPAGTLYLKYRGQTYPVTSRKVLSGIFPDPLQRKIRRYLRQERYSFREADLPQIQKMLQFIAGQPEIVNKP